MDAIEKRRDIDSKFTGKIEIQINSDFKEIVVIDNGIGMSKDMLDRAVQVNESGKIDDPKTIGEKGVGLSFTIFNSGYAEIISTDDKETTRIIATNANLWLRSADEVAFEMPPESLPKLNQRGTKVMLSAINTDDSSFFDLNAAQLEFVIRTRTAIGNVNAIFLENFREIDVFLSYHNSTKAINVEEKKISNSYYLLDDVSKANIIGIDEFNNWLKAGDRSDVQKRQKLQGKYLTVQGSEERSGRKIKYYAYFAPNNDDWSERSKELGLANTDIEKNDPDVSYYELHEGAYLSVKGMPTGISVGTERIQGSSGYVRRMFLIIEDEQLHLDLGRKSIPGRTKGMYVDIEKLVFNKYRTIAQKYIAKDMKAPKHDENISSVFNRSRANLKELDGDTNFSLNPDQEGTISGIFFEQLGKGKFPGLKILEHGYSNVYDIYATDGAFNNIVLEFKQRLGDFLKDAVDSFKSWNEVNYLVVFEITDRDEKDAENLGVALDKFDEMDESHFGASAVITSQFNQPIFVIELAKVIAKDA